MLSYLQVKGRTFIMGDLHGCYDTMQQTLQALAFTPEQGDVVLALGDLTDRGPDSLSCLRLLHHPWFHTIRGNHEQLMLTALLGQSPQARKLWFMNGGSWYENLDATTQAEVITLCQQKVSALPYAMEITTRAQHRVGLVHADPVFSHWQQLINTLRAPTPDPELLEKLLWRRERLHHLRQAKTSTDQRGSPPKDDHIAGIDLICLGHTPLPGEAPWASGNLLWLDNGCFCSNEHDLVILDIDEWLELHPPPYQAMPASAPPSGHIS